MVLQWCFLHHLMVKHSGFNPSLLLQSCTWIQIFRLKSEQSLEWTHALRSRRPKKCSHLQIWNIHMPCLFLLQTSYLANTLTSRDQTSKNGTKTIFCSCISFRQIIFSNRWNLICWKNRWQHEMRFTSRVAFENGFWEALQETTWFLFHLYLKNGTSNSEINSHTRLTSYNVSNLWYHFI